MKPRIDAPIAGAKDHVTDTGSVSFGFAAPNCVYKERNCINMLRVCWRVIKQFAFVVVCTRTRASAVLCCAMDRSRTFSTVWNHFDLLTPNKVNNFLLCLSFTLSLVIKCFYSFLIRV